MATLMSKMNRTIRLAFIAGVVSLQVFLLPATQLLHVTCDHSHHSAGSTTQAKPEHVHCCHHHRHDSHDSEREEGDRNPHFPHDSGSCSICQVVLAARIGELYDVQIPTSDLIYDWTAPDRSDPARALAYALPVRGPPA